MKKNKLKSYVPFDKMERRACLKLEIENIVFPEWESLGLIAKMFRQDIVTKEQAQGHIYEEDKYQIVLRIIGGKVLMSGQPDSYAWKKSKVLENIKKAVKVKEVGIDTPEGLIGLSEMISEIITEEDKKLFAGIFTMFRKNLIAITTPEEQRECIEVTQDMLDAGINYVVDSWMVPDENGEAEETKLLLGDFILIDKDGYYRVRRDEFLETYELL